MNKSKAKNMRSFPARRAARRNTSRGNAGQKLALSIIRSVIAGILVSAAFLCLTAAVFANSNLPLSWIGPAACAASAAGTFVSGFVLSRHVARFRLLAGLGCGIFYCLCSLIGSLATAHMPSLDDANLSLLAVLLLGAVSGSAAGALRGSNGVR